MARLRLGSHLAIKPGSHCEAISPSSVLGNESDGMSYRSPTCHSRRRLFRVSGGAPSRGLNLFNRFFISDTLLAECGAGNADDKNTEQLMPPVRREFHDHLAVCIPLRIGMQSERSMNFHAQAGNDFEIFVEIINELDVGRNTKPIKHVHFPVTLDSVLVVETLRLAKRGGLAVHQRGTDLVCFATEWRVPGEADETAVIERQCSFKRLAGLACPSVTKRITAEHRVIRPISAVFMRKCGRDSLLAFQRAG